MDPNGNLFLRVQKKIKDGKKEKDHERALRHAPSSQQSKETTSTADTAEQKQGTSSGNDSVIIIPDTPSPVFSRFVGKRGKQLGGNQLSSDRYEETGDVSRGPTDSTTKSQRSEGSSHSRSRLPREPMLTPEKHSSPWRQNHNEGKSNIGSVSSPRIVSSFRNKFLDAKSKIALSPGKVKISPYIPSHDIHFKTALQEMMERKQIKSRTESNHPNKNHEQSARKVSHSSAGLSRKHQDHSSESCNHVDDSTKLIHPHSVRPSHKLMSKQHQVPDKEKQHNKELACNFARRKAETSSSPAKSKRARLDGEFHTKEFYPAYHTWPSESSDSGESDDSDFDAVSSQTLQAMIDCSCTPQTNKTSSPACHVPSPKQFSQVHRLKDESNECANHTVTKHAQPKPHLSHVSSLHDITSSRSTNHNPQGHIDSNSSGARRKPEKSDGNKTKNSYTNMKSDQREKMSGWFDDGFSRMTESDWSPTVREESRSHSRKMAAERSRPIQTAALEARAHKNKRTHPSSGTDPGHSLKPQDGSPSQPIICENMPDSTAPQSQIEQVEGDEELAKKLQEQMDMEFAMSLQNLENQPPVFGAGAFPHHDVASPNPAVAYNRGPMAVGQGRWATTQRGRTTSHYPDLDEVEALLRDLDEPEERLLQHSPQGRPMTRNGAWTQQTGQHFLEDIAHLNSSLLSMLEGGSPFIGQPVARHSRSRRRGQRRNTNPRGLDIGSPADGNDYEDLLNLAEMLGDVKNKGLTEAQSSRLPVRTYQANGDKQDSEDCLICMCEYDQGDRLKMLPCFHEFHSQCIDKWIMGNASCPVCRVEVKLT